MRAGAQNPQDAVHKLPVIGACAAWIANLARQQIGNPGPLLIGKFVSLHHSRNSRSRNLESYESHLAPSRETLNVDWT